MAGKSSPLCCNSFPLRPIRLRGKVPAWRYLHHGLLGVKVRKGLREWFALLTLPTRSLLTPALSQFPYIHHYNLRIADTFEPETHGRNYLVKHIFTGKPVLREQLEEREARKAWWTRMFPLSNKQWMQPKWRNVTDKNLHFLKILPQRQSCSCCKKVF